MGKELAVERRPRHGRPRASSANAARTADACDSTDSGKRKAESIPTKGRDPHEHEDEDERSGVERAAHALPSPLMADDAPDATLGTATRDSGSDEGPTRSPEVAALVLLWSAHDPTRSGEVLLVPADQTLVLGRGGERPERGVRARFVRQRPGENTPAAPLADPKLSRAQLEIRATPEGLALRNLGRRRLRIDGAEVDRGVLREGRVARIGERLVLQATRRPLRLPPTVSGAPAAHAFGAPDADGIVGESPAVWALRDRLAFVAPRPLHVLVHGATGSGKELAARAIHRASGRPGALVARNAATIPEGLLDAELFGNVKDYPNPGMREREGLVGRAHEGTLFLDEIGEIPEAMQAHLLRVLDADGEFQRLGEERTRRADLRVVAATNRDPASLKHDLLPRLTLRVHCPGLGERREDVPRLAQTLLAAATEDDPALRERFAEPDGGFRLAPELVEALALHGYRQHVRELHGLLWQSFQSSLGGRLELTSEVRAALDVAPPPPTVAPEELGREDIVAALEAHDGVVSRAYAALGLRSRHQLHRLMKKHGL